MSDLRARPAAEGAPELDAWLGRAPVLNAFPIHDLREAPSETRAWVAADGPRVVAHLVVHVARPYDVPWAYLGGEPLGARLLLEEAPVRRGVVVADRALEPTVAAVVGSDRVFHELVMAVERATARPRPSPEAERLGPEWAEAYARRVVPPSIPVTAAVIERNRAHLERRTVYGIVEGGETLVSIAGASVETDAAWIVGGVETLPAFRRRGYATQVTSAVLRDALERVERAGLWVREENAGAIRLYERLGFRPVGATTWFDVGTGLEP